MKQLLALSLALLPFTLRAEEKDETLAKQKEAAEANWKRMEFAKQAPAVMETPNFLIYSRLPEAKTKALAASLDKIYATALKPLKYDAKDPPWPGKLAVFVLPERGEFVQFMRKFARKSPGEDEITHHNMSGDIGMIVAGAPKIGVEDPEELTRNEMIAMLLSRKLGGADAPDWLAPAYARVVNHRMTKQTKVLSRAPNAPFSALWNADIVANAKLPLATYLVDYLAFGPNPELFTTFVGALRPGENGGTPPYGDVLAAMKLDEASLEVIAKYWRKLPTPKPPKKP